MLHCIASVRLYAPCFDDVTLNGYTVWFAVICAGERTSRTPGRSTGSSLPKQLSAARARYKVSSRHPVHLVGMLEKQLVSSPRLQRVCGCEADNGSISCCEHSEMVLPVPLAVLLMIANQWAVHDDAFHDDRRVTIWLPVLAFSGKAIMC